MEVEGKVLKYTENINICENHMKWFKMDQFGEGIATDIFLGNVIAI